MDRQQKFGIGIVGAGMAVTPHVRALKDLEKTIAVRGVYTRNKSNREAFAAEHGFAAVDSYEALLADDSVDAILLLTPPNARLELVRAAAQAGKHILMEKPVERTTEAAAEIVEICEQAGVTLGVIFQFRFREGSLAARELMTKGDVGPLANTVLVVPWWRSADYYSEPGRGTFAQDGGGVLLTQAIHALDLMLSLTGQAESVQAVAGTTPLHDIEVEDFVSAGLRFENGALGAIIATTAAFPGDHEYLLLNCTKASLKLSGSVLTVHWHDGRVETVGQETTTGAGDNRMAFPHDWHRAQIADFVSAVQSGRAPASTGRTALRAHRLIDAILTSSRDGALVAVVQD